MGKFEIDTHKIGRRLTGVVGELTKGKLTDKIAKSVLGAGYYAGKGVIEDGADPNYDDLPDGMGPHDQMKKGGRPKKKMKKGGRVKKGHRDAFTQQYD